MRRPLARHRRVDVCGVEDEGEGEGEDCDCD